MEWMWAVALIHNGDLNENWSQQLIHPYRSIESDRLNSTHLGTGLGATDINTELLFNK